MSDECLIYFYCSPALPFHSFIMLKNIYSAKYEIKRETLMLEIYPFSDVGMRNLHCRVAASNPDLVAFIRQKMLNLNKIK